MDFLGSRLSRLLILASLGAGLAAAAPLAHRVRRSCAWQDPSTLPSLLRLSTVDASGLDLLLLRDEEPDDSQARIGKDFVPSIRRRASVRTVAWDTPTGRNQSSVVHPEDRLESLSSGFRSASTTLHAYRRGPPQA